MFLERFCRLGSWRSRVIFIKTAKERRVLEQTQVCAETFLPERYFCWCLSSTCLCSFYCSCVLQAALSLRCWRSAQEECASGTLKQSQCRVPESHTDTEALRRFSLSKARILGPRTAEASGTFLWVSLHGSLWVALIRISALLVWGWRPCRSSGFSRAAFFQSFIHQKGEETD